MAMFARLGRAQAPANQVAELPLMQVATKVRRAFGTFDADLRRGGFGQNSLGLARELYVSFAATAVATHGTEAETLTWAIGRALALDLDAFGAPKSASALLIGLWKLGDGVADERSLELVRQSWEAIERRAAESRRTTASPEQPTANFLGRAVDAVQQLQTSSGRAFARRIRGSGGFRSATLWKDHRIHAAILGMGAVVILASFSTYTFVTREEASRQHAAPISSADATAANAGLPIVASAKGGDSGDLFGADPSGRPTKAMATSLSRGVQDISDRTFHQLRLWLDKANPGVKRVVVAAPASDREPLLDLKTQAGAAAVQARLKTLGYYHRSVDGKWGPKSAAALSKFRQHAGFGTGPAWNPEIQSALMAEGQ